jgi:hypothetical protein
MYKMNHLNFKLRLASVEEESGLTPKNVFQTKQKRQCDYRNEKHVFFIIYYATLNVKLGSK